MRDKWMIMKFYFWSITTELDLKSGMTDEICTSKHDHFGNCESQFETQFPKYYQRIPFKLKRKFMRYVKFDVTTFLSYNSHVHPLHFYLVKILISLRNYCIQNMSLTKYFFLFSFYFFNQGIFTKRTRDPMHLWRSKLWRCLDYHRGLFVYGFKIKGV